MIAVYKRTGVIAWRARATPVPNVPRAQATVVAGPVVIYPDGVLHAFERHQGTLKWVFSGDPGSYPGFAVPTSAGGRVFAGSYTGVVYALADSTGALEWRLPSPVSYAATAYDPVADGGQVFVGYAARVSGNQGALPRSMCVPASCSGCSI